MMNVTDCFLLNNGQLDSLVRNIIDQQSISTLYIPPRGALDTFYKSHRHKSKQQQMENAVHNTRIIVCQKCAGAHHSNLCTAKLFRCHTCGADGHRSFECTRAQCRNCLKLGHLTHKCPLMNSMSI